MWVDYDWKLRNNPNIRKKKNVTSETCRTRTTCDSLKFTRFLQLVLQIIITKSSIKSYSVDVDRAIQAYMELLSTCDVHLKIIPIPAYPLDSIFDNRETGGFLKVAVRIQ